MATAHDLSADLFYTTQDQKASRKRQWPPNLVLNADMLAIACAVGLPARRVSLEWDKFHDHALAHASKYANWNAAWRFWARTAAGGRYDLEQVRFRNEPVGCGTELRRFVP